MASTYSTIKDLGEKTTPANGDYLAVYDSTENITKKTKISDAKNLFKTTPTVTRDYSIGDNNPADISVAIVYSADSTLARYPILKIPEYGGTPAVNRDDFYSVIYNSSGKIYKTKMSNLPFLAGLPETVGVTPPDPIVYCKASGGSDSHYLNAISAIERYLIHGNDKDTHGNPTATAIEVTNALSDDANCVYSLGKACEVLRHFRASRSVTYRIKVLDGTYDYTSLGTYGTSMELSHPDAVGNNLLIIEGVPDSGAHVRVWYPIINFRCVTGTNPISAYSNGYYNDNLRHLYYFNIHGNVIWRNLSISSDMGAAGNSLTALTSDSDYRPPSNSDGKYNDMIFFNVYEDGNLTFQEGVYIYGGRRLIHNVGGNVTINPRPGSVTNIPIAVPCKELENTSKTFRGFWLENCSEIYTSTQNSKSSMTVIGSDNVRFDVGRGFVIDGGTVYIKRIHSFEDTNKVIFFNLLCDENKDISHGAGIFDITQNGALKFTQDGGSELNDISCCFNLMATENRRDESMTSAVYKYQLRIGSGTTQLGPNTEKGQTEIPTSNEYFSGLSYFNCADLWRQQLMGTGEVQSGKGWLSSENINIIGPTWTFIQTSID